MKKKSSVAISITAMSLLVAVTLVAWAGVVPSPMRVSIVNNSHMIDPGEPMYNQAMKPGGVEFYYLHALGEPPTLWGTASYPAVAPGEQSDPDDSVWTPIGSFPPDPYYFFVKHGGLMNDVTEFPMYSFAPGTVAVPEDPGEAPLYQYPAECKAPERCAECHGADVPSHPIFAFASPGVMVGSLHVESVEEITVSIDIKPGSYPNAINLASQGLIPVAILSTEDFDASTVDPDTVELGGSGVAVKGRGAKSMAHMEDVNGDGAPDLVVQVETANLDPGSLQDGLAILTGQTYDGQSFEGSDDITVVPQ